MNYFLIHSIISLIHCIIPHVGDFLILYFCNLFYQCKYGRIKVSFFYLIYIFSFKKIKIFVYVIFRIYKIKFYFIINKNKNKNHFYCKFRHL